MKEKHLDFRRYSPHSNKLQISEEGTYYNKNKTKNKNTGEKRKHAFLGLEKERRASKTQGATLPPSGNSASPPPPPCLRLIWDPQQWDQNRGRVELGRPPWQAERAEGYSLSQGHSFTQNFYQGEKICPWSMNPLGQESYLFYINR